MEGGDVVGEGGGGGMGGGRTFCCDPNPVLVHRVPQIQAVSPEPHIKPPAPSEVQEGVWVLGEAGGEEV